MRATVQKKSHARGEVAKTIPPAIPFLLPADETFDVGIDTRTGVNEGYKVPFPFNGTINRVTFNLGPTQLTSDEHQTIGARPDALETSCNAAF
jgi:hypothetical protein